MKGYLYVSSKNINFFEQSQITKNGSIIMQTFSKNEFAFPKNNSYYYAIELEIENCTIWQVLGIFENL